jgi:hypothetical protein
MCGKNTIFLEVLDHEPTSLDTKTNYAKHSSNRVCAKTKHGIRVHYIKSRKKFELCIET